MIARLIGTLYFGQICMRMIVLTYVLYYSVRNYTVKFFCLQYTYSHGAGRTKRKRKPIIKIDIFFQIKAKMKMFYLNGWFSYWKKRF